MDQLEIDIMEAFDHMIGQSEEVEFIGETHTYCVIPATGDNDGIVINADLMNQEEVDLVANGGNPGNINGFIAFLNVRVGILYLFDEGMETMSPMTREIVIDAAENCATEIDAGFRHMDENADNFRKFLRGEIPRR